jgi:hypothetical protein
LTGTAVLAEVAPTKVNGVEAADGMSGNDIKLDW